jgi:hypothetical protein
MHQVCARGLRALVHAAKIQIYTDVNDKTASPRILWNEGRVSLNDMCEPTMPSENARQIGILTGTLSQESQPKDHHEA